MKIVLNLFLILITVNCLTNAVIFPGRCNENRINYLKNITIDNLLTMGDKFVYQYYDIATYGFGVEDKMCVTEQFVKINSSVLEGVRQYLIRGDKSLIFRRAKHTIYSTDKPGVFDIIRQDSEGTPYSRYKLYVLTKNEDYILFYLCRDLWNNHDVVIFVLSSTQSGITNMNYGKLQNSLQKNNIDMNYVQYVENGITLCQH